MQINQDLSPFEAEVLKALTRLETKMDDLVGTNGNPGRIPTLESRVSRLTVGFVVLAVLGGGAAIGPHAITLISSLLK